MPATLFAAPAQPFPDGASTHVSPCASEMTPPLMTPVPAGHETVWGDPAVFDGTGNLALTILVAPTNPGGPCGPAGPRAPAGPALPFSAFLALALRSIVWIVPFLMFLLVTTNAAVADAVETSIATTPAMIALFMVLPPDSFVSSRGACRGRRCRCWWWWGRRRRWRRWIRAQQTEDVPEQRPRHSLDVDEDLVQISDQPEQVEMHRSEDEMQDVALGDLHRCDPRRAHSRHSAARCLPRRVDDRLEAHDRGAPHLGGQRLRRAARLALRGGHAPALGEIAEQPSEDAARPPSLKAEANRLVRVEGPRDDVQAGERQVDLADLQEQDLAEGLLLSPHEPHLRNAMLGDRQPERLPFHARRAVHVRERGDDGALPDDAPADRREAVDDHPRRNRSRDLARCHCRWRRRR